MTYAPERPPLRFVSPPEWPQPSPAWVARNQAWQPPAGWVPPVDSTNQQPATGTPAPTPTPTPVPAPAGWRFWVEDPQSWATYRAPYAKSVHRTLLIGGVMFGVGAIITLAGYLGELGGTFLILWGAIVFGAIRIVTGLRNLRKIDGIARGALVGHARQVRRELDESAYPYYLDRTAHERAETGRPAMALDEFAIARDAEPWLYLSPAGQPSAVAGSAGPGTAWTSEPPIELARSRRGLWIGAGAVVALAIGLAIPIALAPHSQASTAGSSISSADTNSDSAASGGNYVLPSDAWGLVKGGACSSADGCWQIVVTPEKACAAATITWGFSDSTTGDDKAVRTSKLPFVAHQTSRITIPIDSELKPLEYIFMDRVDCAA